MNEDENGVTPANVTSMSIQRDGDLWWVIIEQGNGDVIKDIKLTDMERIQLGCLLAGEEATLLEELSFVDFDRAAPTA